MHFEKKIPLTRPEEMPETQKKTVSQQKNSNQLQNRLSLKVFNSVQDLLVGTTPHAPASTFQSTQFGQLPMENLLFQSARKQR